MDFDTNTYNPVQVYVLQCGIWRVVAKLGSVCSHTQQAEGEIPSMLVMLCLDFSGTVQGISTAHCICL